MKIAFYIAKHGKFEDKIISFLTKSPYSHVEMVFSDGICASSSQREDGVRFKKINIYNGKWDVYEVKDIFCERLVRQWFVDNDGDKYDWTGAVGSWLGIDLYKEDRKFCSQSCAIVLDRFRNQTPASLYKDLMDNGIIFKD